MKRLLGLVLVLASFAASAETEKDLVAKSMAGDYQAQRNLAYGYAAGAGGQKKDPQLACSWYLLVVRSDSPKLNVGDIGNLATYCDKLDLEKRLAAERKANSLHQQIYGKK